MEANSRAHLFDSHVLWDVVEEHIDEADFMFAQWERGLTSHLYTIDTLSNGPESRLLAHVDGLVMNGMAVAERVLLPVLRSEEATKTRAAVASLALLGLGRQDAVVDAMLTSGPVTASGAERALILAATAEFDAWLSRAHLQEMEEKQRAALLRVAAERGIVIPNLLLHLQSKDADVAAAAARAALWSDARMHAEVLEYLLKDSRQLVADAALFTALVHGSRSALAHSSERAADTERPQRLPMMMTALLGGPAQHKVLMEHLERDSHRPSALFALGYSGQLATVPMLIAHLDADNQESRKLAAEAIGTLTGLDPTADAFISDCLTDVEGELTSLEDDLACDLLPSAVDALPTPDVDAISRWWEANKQCIDRRYRCLLGMPWSRVQALTATEVLSMRRRHPVEQWLLVQHGPTDRSHLRSLPVQSVAVDRAR